MTPPPNPWRGVAVGVFFFMYILLLDPACASWTNHGVVPLRHSRYMPPDSRGGATVVKVGGTISRAERAKKFFDPPTFDLPGGDMKQDIAVFFTAIMTSDL